MGSQEALCITMLSSRVSCADIQAAKLEALQSGAMSKWYLEREQKSRGELAGVQCCHVNQSAVQIFKQINLCLNKVGSSTECGTMSSVCR